MNVLDIFAHRAVDGLTVAHIGQIDDDLAQMLHRAAGLLDQLPDILHDLVGLLDRIMACDVFGGVEVLGALAAQKHGPAARHHGLAQVVVELLLWIGVLGVELADTRMCHGAPFCLGRYRDRCGMLRCGLFRR